MERNPNPLARFAAALVTSLILIITVLVPVALLFFIVRLIVWCITGVGL